VNHGVQLSGNAEDVLSQVDSLIERLEYDSAKDESRAKLFEFLSWVWWYPEVLKVGRHTREICERITQAVDDFQEGKSTYLLIQVPFRHGKSDIVSRALPPYFLGRTKNDDVNVLMTAYGGGLSEGFSKDCKRIIRSDEYQELYPGLLPAKGKDNISEWSVGESTGSLNFVGLGGTAVGKGAHLLVIDDYCKNRAEARSRTIRNKVWDAFSVDLMSRLANRHIVIITATPWHVDDLAGRLTKLMAEEPDFPRFEVVKFPAGGVDGPYLFPELYPESWYRMQYASQGKLAAANLDCNPTIEGGNRFSVDDIVVHDDLSKFPAGRYVRVWDLASSSKDRSGDDPDYTVGTLGLAVKKETGNEFWIKDVVYCQEEAPKRDKLIIDTMKKDGQHVPIGIEGFGSQKDTYNNLKALIAGRRIVKKLTPPGDKEEKASVMEAPMEYGNFHILKAPWNTEFVKWFSEFPDGNHDDFVDSAALVWYMSYGKGTGSAAIMR